MGKSILELFDQKKGVAMLVGIMLAILSSWGILIPEDALNQVLSPIIAYIIGQGIADRGKEEALITRGFKR